jgi:lysyl-tRNA synthetase class 2
MSVSSAPFWHPSEFARRKPHLEIRQRVIAALRGYFAGQDFAEVETPILQTMPGGEAHLHAFATELRGPRPGPAQKLYLHTSPEIAMKKLLAAGVPRLYQVARVFRNGERSPQHHPEFTMLEWYRAEADLDDILRDSENLVRAAAKAAGRKNFVANGMECDPFAAWETLSVAEAFTRYAGIDLLATMPAAKHPDAGRLAAALQKNGLRAKDGESWDDLFFRVMGEKIEPYLGRGRPAVLRDYPVSMAALARPKASDPRLAERAEIYICGIELANGFFELTDAAEQARRLEADMAHKKKLYGETWPVDEDFIAALRFGMPDCAGIALGLDRLVMLCSGAEKIDDVLWALVAES